MTDDRDCKAEAHEMGKAVAPYGAFVVGVPAAVIAGVSVGTVGSPVLAAAGAGIGLAGSAITYSSSLAISATNLSASLPGVPGFSLGSGGSANVGYTNSE